MEGSEGGNTPTNPATITSPAQQRPPRGWLAAWHHMAWRAMNGHAWSILGDELARACAGGPSGRQPASTKQAIDTFFFFPFCPSRCCPPRCDLPVAAWHASPPVAEGAQTLRCPSGHPSIHPPPPSIRPSLLAGPGFWESAQTVQCRHSTSLTAVTELPNFGNRRPAARARTRSR